MGVECSLLSRKQKGMLTTFAQNNFGLEFPEILSLLYYAIID